MKVRDVMKEYLVVYERAGKNYSAYVPDLPGCVAAGDTLEETEQLIKEAIELYIEALRADGKPVPEPTTKARSVAVVG
jgi:predicted RNase H-like HicB family nuclease